MFGFIPRIESLRRQKMEEGEKSEDDLVGPLRMVPQSIFLISYDKIKTKCIFIVAVSYCYCFNVSRKPDCYLKFESYIHDSVVYIFRVLRVALKDSCPHD